MTSIVSLKDETEIAITMTHDSNTSSFIQLYTFDDKDKIFKESSDLFNHFKKTENKNSQEFVCQFLPHYNKENTHLQLFFLQNSEEEQKITIIDHKLDLIKRQSESFIHIDPKSQDLLNNSLPNR